jgi:hypothetical protein
MRVSKDFSGGSVMSHSSNASDYNRPIMMVGIVAIVSVAVMYLLEKMF